MARSTGIAYVDGPRLRRALLSQFLLGLRDGLGDRLTATSHDLARAIGRGFDRLHESLDEPVEGTIVTVARETSDEAAQAQAEPDLQVFMRRLVDRAEQALRRTPELLAVLKSAGVVDAGALGFVRLLDGVRRLIEEGRLAEGAVHRLVPDAAAQTEAAAVRDSRFCLGEGLLVLRGLELAGGRMGTRRHRARARAGAGPVRRVLHGRQFRATGPFGTGGAGASLARHQAQHEADHGVVS